jgi:hypothetical protein
MRKAAWTFAIVICALITLPLLGPWLFLGALWVTDAFAPSKPYTGPSIEGVVVDATTGAPLEDVIVVVRWDEIARNLEGSPLPGSPIELAEATTGVDGTFAMPSWGPVQVPEKEDVQPSSVFLRAGYEVAVIHGFGIARVALTVGTPDHLVVYNEFNPTFRTKGCLWKKAPRTIDAILSSSKDARYGEHARQSFSEGMRRAVDQHGSCG